MRSQLDTIAAIATAPGESAISIVRLSGPESLTIADTVFRCKGARPSARPPGSFILGSVWTGGTGDAESERIDQVILLVYRAPHSYTRQDVVEMQGHGGHRSAQRILRAVLDAGARPAEPGEFTLRAFLSGRIDLVQAEAVADLIRARTDRAAGAAVQQLAGLLSTSLATTYENMLAAVASIEASLDFPEEDTPSDPAPGALALLDRAASELQRLLATWQEGRILRNGLLVVISGRPNVGKSTLLNTLLGVDRAIVHHIPGTTRDSIEEAISLDGLPLRLVDTAGIRAPRTEVERLGIDRAKALLAEADLVLYMLDASRRLAAADSLLIATLDASKTILVLNKADLGIRIPRHAFASHHSVLTSLTSGTGVSDLKLDIARTVGASTCAESHATISERHRVLVSEALSHLNQATALLRAASPDGEALAATSLRAGLAALGAITGRIYDAELLSSIFNSFCIGK